MQILIILAALGLLMFVAYRGASVILFAPVAALLAVLVLDPHALLPVYSGLFMERMANFMKLYFPVFLLGAVFGKLTEISGFAESIIRAVLNIAGPHRAILSVVVVCALLTYGGVSLFVVAFAVYPFGAGLFRHANIPKRLLPPAIAFGAFTFTMDSIPGTPQIQNIIPTTFFHTNAWAAPRLGIAGALFQLVLGLAYLEWRKHRARLKGEGYGANHINEPELHPHRLAVHPLIAVVPLFIVAGVNLWLTSWIPAHYNRPFNFAGSGILGVESLDPSKFVGLWAVECALVVAIVFITIWCLFSNRGALIDGTKQAVGGAMLATFNTGSEYGFGAVIAALPGFRLVSQSLTGGVGNPLVSMAITTNVLAGLTGSASGGLSIALGAMSDTFIKGADAHGIPHEVLHRVAAIASGGMDTLPHNGAIITLLAISGLTHRHSYRDIFALTLLKTASVFFVISLYYAFGIV
jgi:H+/gluconate symporter-like permease